MCIIIDNSSGCGVSEEIAKRCVKINNDGFGFYDCNTGALHRTMDMKAAVLMLQAKTPFVAHCRYATQGKASLDNVHPFRMADGSLLFQNGTVDGFSKWHESDTRQMAELLQYVKPMEISNFLGSFDSRFLIIHPDGSILRTGDWKEHGGVWYSKDNVLSSRSYKNSWTYNRYGGCGYQDFESWNSGTKNAITTRSASTPRTTTKNAHHLVGVYGTLRYGQSNHNHYLLDSELIAEGRTVSPYRLCVRGLPYLIRKSSYLGFNVEIEVYEVDHDSLARIDMLEGHPHFYKREQIMVESYAGERMLVWVYFVDETYDDGEYYESFEDGKYIPTVVEDEEEDDPLEEVICEVVKEEADDAADTQSWYNTMSIRGFHV